MAESGCFKFRVVSNIIMIIVNFGTRDSNLNVPVNLNLKSARLGLGILACQ